MNELHEIRKQKIIELVNEEFYVPMKLKEMAQLMQVSPEERNELEACLRELVLEGKLQKTVKGKYIKGDGSVAVGTFIANPRGFGFVEVDGREEDLFVSEDRVHGAMHTDIVRVQILPKRGGKRQEAEVTEIITRGFTTLVGTYQASKNYGFVIPDNQKFGFDIFVAKEHTAGAVEGHKVIVEITDYGDASGRRNPEGKIIEILGHMDDPGVDILSIVKNYDLPVDFTEKELNQAERVSKPVSDADREGRMDLRDLQMVTIDGEDSKDLDDAVSLTVGEDGIYHLGVHIADVTNYVQEGSALDREALKRGTSVYLVDRVIPMLPHTLSNGICSLNAGEDRLALSCLMDIDPKGNIVDYQITESVINVDRRMTYTAVNGIIEHHDEGLMKEYAPLVDMFLQMADLSMLLRRKRRKRGAIDFDLQECKIHLDAQGHVTEILPYERNRATRLIEDFMLAANETVAEHFYWMSVPFVYRTHEMPDPDKMKQLRLMAAGMGYPLKTGKEEIHPKEIQKLLDKIEGTQAESYLSRLTLRSMKRAVYQMDCTGHFGLACQYYCHFTSPIRRYPDLQIHRIIKEQLRGRLNDARKEHYAQILEGVCKQASTTERRADEAERTTEKVKKAQYMADKIGEQYEGVISSITAWGIYVELPNTVEGMIPVSELLDDYYIFDQEHFTMIGEHSHRTFVLGQTMRVEVERVDTDASNIDFALVRDRR